MRKTGNSVAVKMSVSPAKINNAEVYKLPSSMYRIRWIYVHGRSFFILWDFAI